MSDFDMAPSRGREPVVLQTTAATPLVVRGFDTVTGNVPQAPQVVDGLTRGEWETGQQFADRVNAGRRAKAEVGRYKRFLPIAMAYAQMSKDPSTKVGAVILGPGLEVRSSGWNGAPRKSKADEDSRFEDRAEKLHWVMHAEANAITNAARCGTALEGCVLVCTHAPCMSCAKMIVQAGITKVVNPKPDPEFAARWAEDFSRAARLFDEAGVVVLEVE